MAYIDFKDVKARFPILDVANRLGITVKREAQTNKYRGNCPHCDEKRTFVITTDGGYDKLGLSGCHKCGNSADSIKLVSLLKGFQSQREAAEFILDEFGTPTVPKEAERGKEDKRISQPRSVFDPVKFGNQLVWHEDVAKLNLTEEQAKRFGIGYHPNRKAVYIPALNPDGQVSGYFKWDGTTLTPPPQWLEAKSNVVPLRRA